MREGLIRPAHPGKPDPAETRAGKIRLCHIAATTEGALWLFEQLRDLRDRFGYDVTVILNGSQGTLVDRFKDAGIPILISDFNFLGSGDLFSLPKKVWQLSRLLKRERFDVVQTHLFHSMVIGRVAAWLADVPVRLAMVAGPFHLEAYTPRWIDASTEWMETALVPSCNFSRALYRSMGVGPERLHVIYYGPDEASFSPDRHMARDFRTEFGWPAETPLIGMVAYFYAELGKNRWTPLAVHGHSVKSQSELIAAMPEILRDFPDAKLLLVGRGWEEGGRQYFAKMQALVEKLGLAESVRFTDYVESVPAALKAFDVVVQASRSENLGGSIEGLLMERPMVVTRTGGLVDSVIDGRTGIVVEPADPLDLARGIKTLLGNPELGRRLARSGRALMLEKFTLRRTVEDEDRLYRKLLSDASAGYRPSRQALRIVIAAFVGAYASVRYRFFDAYLLPALDAGWRPWHFVRLRRLFLRLIAFAVRMLSTTGIVSLRRSDTHRRSIDLPWLDKASRDRVAAFSEQFLSPQAGDLPSIFPRLRVTLRMMRYRFYSWVGRQKFGWGIRSRVKNAIRRMLGR